MTTTFQDISGNSKIALITIKKLVAQVPYLATDQLQELALVLQKIESSWFIKSTTIAEKINFKPPETSHNYATILLLAEFHKLVNLIKNQINSDYKLMHEALHNEIPIGIGYEYLPEFE